MMTGRNNSPKNRGPAGKPSRVEQFSDQHEPFAGKVVKKDLCD
ncbi:hypothetical protein [Marinicrinis lubricantis]|uniref:Uncharacterized protein n=1 Tax=Marinicrinis lubricantis TaxID=2086470 RepID=A0ABW1IVH7_9BACL